MQNLRCGRYQARKAGTQADLAGALALRAKCFRKVGDDRDALDAACEHMIIERIDDQSIVCTFRLMPFANGTHIHRSYAAQYYDLNALQRYPDKMVELGRFCIDTPVPDPDVLRVAWGALTQYVDDNSVALLFGCSSFQGTLADPYLDTFSLLHQHHIAPYQWRPQVKSDHVFPFADRIPANFDRKTALRGVPPLLKTYLGMGGWVSDHAVVDNDLGTLHVFTGLEIAAIPPARARALRAVTGLIDAGPVSA